MPQHLHVRTRRSTARFTLVAVLVLFSSLMFAVSSASGAPLSGSRFEADDGNLKVNAASEPPHDWNSFKDASATATAFNFMQQADAAALATDVIFASGKHDDDCPVLTQNKALNKGDFTRFYLANHKATSG